MNLTTIKLDTTICNWNNLFNTDELNSITHYCESFNKETAGIGGGNLSNNSPPEQIRKSRVSWINRNQNSDWFFDKIHIAVNKLNSRFFGFDINPIDVFQYTLYDDRDSHYNWHWDMHVGNSLEELYCPKQRKVSAVLQLSDPNDYQGGDLEFNECGNIKTVERKQGLLCIFPSFMLHRVTPVKRGIRKTLVGWFDGPDWR